jgi:RHS repeat-associated protein
LGPATLAVINDYLQEKGLSLRQGTIVDATIIHAPSFNRRTTYETNQTMKHLFYNGQKTQTHLAKNTSTSLLRSSTQALAFKKTTTTECNTTLLATDRAGSITMHHADNARSALAYAPYGYSNLSWLGLFAMGFNDELFHPETEGYLLGNVCRLFKPTLQRFISPDKLSPFGDGGINAYTYCKGDPINLHDPTGETPQPVNAQNLKTAPSTHINRSLEDILRIDLIGENILNKLPPIALGALSQTSKSNYTTTSKNSVRNYQKYERLRAKHEIDGIIKPEFFDLLNNGNGMLPLERAFIDTEIFVISENVSNMYIEIRSLALKERAAAVMSGSTKSLESVMLTIRVSLNYRRQHRMVLNSWNISPP